MDVFFIYQGLRFVWDATKATSNFAKHGVRFEKACEVFFDPMLLLDHAGAPADPDDVRTVAVGVTNDHMTLFVVHVLRESDTVRIISARHATKSERRSYEDDK